MEKDSGRKRTGVSARAPREFPSVCAALPAEVTAQSVGTCPRQSKLVDIGSTIKVEGHIY
ncbi:hypothetical protein BC832DRAFT_547146 [Gaertneriomyces semiglobifer]|nr:hypothetical protein BC832DRAFT_547146 [Gaertneriomyces semiglobifer]